MKKRLTMKARKPIRLYLDTAPIHFLHGLDLLCGYVYPFHTGQTPLNICFQSVCTIDI